jgi:signal transduction histidine kinase
VWHGGREPYGLLLLVSGSDGAYAGADEDWISLVAGELGSALARHFALASAQASAAKLRHLNEELEAFTYTASHDLSEPLRGIETLSAYLLERESDLGDEQRDLVERIHRAAHRLKAMVGSLLELSRSTRRGGEPQWIDAGDVLAEAIADVQEVLSKRGAAIEVEGAFPWVCASPVRLRVILSNLLSNAVRHNDKPGPRVWAGAKEGADAHRFWVRDNGPGIPRGFEDRIFQLFQRGPGVAGSGVGAGLAIVKRLVEAEGGEIRVESRRGEGARFEFTIPTSRFNCP